MEDWRVFAEELATQLLLPLKMQIVVEVCQGIGTNQHGFVKSVCTNIRWNLKVKDLTMTMSTSEQQSNTWAS